MPCAAGELCAVQELTPVAQRCAMKGWGGAQVEGFVTPVVMQFKRIVSYSSSDVCAQFSPRDLPLLIVPYFYIFPSIFLSSVFFKPPTCGCRGRLKSGRRSVSSKAGVRFLC